MNTEINVSQLIIKNNNLKKLNKDYNNLINKNKSVIKENEKLIWKLCKHDWVTDYGSYDSIKQYCKKCNLWRDRYMYQ